MATQLEKDFDFQAAVHFDNNFFINLYSFSILFDIQTESIREQNISLERMKYLIFEILENCIFVHDKDSKAIEKYKNAGIKVCVIPNEVYDQIIALIILLKLNAICEDKIKVTDIKLTSKHSDGVKFIEQLETARLSILEEGWWNDPTPNVNGKLEHKKDKIVKLVKNGWDDLGLSWKEKKPKSSEIVFTVKPDKNP